MLDALRKSVGSWFVKAFIGVIMLSFAVWGVSDVFRGYRGAEVARVGDTEIPVEVFRDSLQREIQAISQQVGTYLTLDQARSLGLDRRVLGRLIAQAALDDEARRRGLSMSDSAVADSIRADPSFRGPGGQFDRSYFNQFLRATGYSEGAYVAEQRRRLLRHSIGEAVGGNPMAPEALAAAVDRYQNEERSAEYLLLTADLLEELPSPGEEELRQYFEENRSEFRAPEYRRLALIPVEPEALLDTIEVSEEDAQAYFEARVGQFQQVERRTVEQITFASLEDAAAAQAEIEAGASFEEIAAAQGVSDDERVLGTLSRDEIVDEAVAEAAFALAEGEISEPVEGVFAVSLLRVTGIEGGDSPAFEDVAEEVRRQLAMERAQGVILDFYDAVEDDRAAGLTLAEIAQRHELPYREIEAVDRQGRGPDGDPVADLPQAQQLIQEAFQTDVGIEADPVQLGVEGYLWFDVLDIIPARDREFEEARELVRARWIENRTRDAIAARADEIADRLRAGAELVEIAGELDIEVATVGPLTRGDTEGPFGRAATGRLFTTAQGAVVVAEAADPLERIVFRLTEATLPSYTPSEDDPYAQEIVAGLGDDLIGQYIAQLHDRLGVTINQQALRRAFGETDEF